MGRPSSSNPVEDTHPGLQKTSFMKTQIMVFYDSAIETPRNEVEDMLSQCPKSIY